MRKWIIVLIGLAGCTISDEVKRDQFFIKANQELANQEYKSAIELYDLALQLDADFAEGYNNRGVAKVEDDRPEEAILDYNQAIQLKSDYFEALFNRAYAYEALGRFELALDDIERIEPNYQDSSFLYFYKGLLLNSLRDYPNAVVNFKKAIVLDSENMEALVNLATLYFFIEDMDSARILLRNVLQINPREPNAYNTFSQIYLAERDFQNALISINYALDILPQEPYFLNNRGLIYLEMDSLDYALNDINQSIRLDPKNAWAYRNKGIFYMKKNDFDQAIRLFNESLKRNKFIDDIYSYLGKAQFELNQKAEACESWKQGVQLKEKRSEMFFEQYCN